MKAIRYLNMQRIQSKQAGKVCTRCGNSHTTGDCRAEEMNVGVVVRLDTLQESADRNSVSGRSRAIRASDRKPVSRAGYRVI